MMLGMLAGLVAFYLFRGKIRIEAGRVGGGDRGSYRSNGSPTG